MEFEVVSLGRQSADERPRTETVALLPSQLVHTLSIHPRGTVCAPSPPIYSIRDAGVAGLGVFAAKSIQIGELITEESPLCIYPQLLPYHRAQPPERRYLELDRLIARMEDQTRAAFLSLANVHPEEPSPPKGIIDTNALYVGEFLPGCDMQFAAICKDIARINHSCSPNIVYRWDSEKLAFQLRAVLPISAGEQLFLAYVDTAAARAVRQAALSDYAFVCACPSCSLSGLEAEQSDARRSLIASADKGRERRDAALEEWLRSAPDASSHIITVDRAYMSLFRMERLYYEPVWEAYASRIFRAYRALGDRAAAREVAALAAALSIAYTGEDHGWIANATAVGGS